VSEGQGGDRSDDERAPLLESPDPRDRYHCGVVTRVYYGSESGTLQSHATGREYRFRGALCEIRGPIPRVGGLREGMEVGFDLSRTSSGTWVSLICVFD
jgi:hypothetical protein